MTVTGLVHVNINCRDFDRSLSFYELLGFQKLVDVPAKNTPEVAAAVGMPPYTVKGALLILKNSKIPKTEILYVGNSLEDFESSRYFKINFIHFQNEYLVQN